MIFYFILKDDKSMTLIKNHLKTGVCGKMLKHVKEKKKTCMTLICQLRNKTTCFFSEDN